jgi:hypothetical protein
MATFVRLPLVAVKTEGFKLQGGQLGNRWAGMATQQRGAAAPKLPACWLSQPAVTATDTANSKGRPAAALWLQPDSNRQ